MSSGFAASLRAGDEHADNEQRPETGADGEEMREITTLYVPVPGFAAPRGWDRGRLRSGRCLRDRRGRGFVPAPGGEPLPLLQIDHAENEEHDDQGMISSADRGPGQGKRVVHRMDEVGDDETESRCSWLLTCPGANLAMPTK